MFAKMKLRQRILLGYLAPLLLLLGAMGLVWVNVQEAKHQSALLEHSREVASEIAELHFAQARMQRSTRGYMLGSSLVEHQNYQNGDERFIKASDALKVMIKDPRQQETLGRIVELQQALRPLQQQMLDLTKEGKSAAALAVFRSEKPAALVTAQDEAVRNFERREMEIVRERQAAEDAALAMVVSSIIYGMLGAIVLAVGIALWLAAVLSRNITANAAQLSTAATEIAATVAQHERTASQQATAASETSVTIEELSVSSGKSSEQAANAAALAEKAGAATAQGGEAIRSAVAAMGGLKDRIGVLAERIVHLSEQTGQIGNIAVLVKDLSAQINMLALNAAVEAARAGEHGKGFAVVASEVRKLADESKKSAEQASLLVADTQKAADASVMMTEESTRTVSEVTQLAGKVAELFESISGMAGSVNENAQQVMLNARQQSAAFSQIVEATNSIATGARETAAAIGQTKIGVQTLNEAAANLKAIA